MKTDLKDLRESNEFLKLLLENSNTAVLIADEDLRIHQVNNFFIQLFDGALEDVVTEKLGKATGCEQMVKENKPCGETSRCHECVLRKSLIETMFSRVPMERTSLKRSFYIHNELVEKSLELTTRHVTFNGRQMVLVFIYDITEIEKQRIELQKKQAQINEDLAAAGEIQRSLLPVTVPRSERMHMAWKFEPSWKVGGDIFNVFNYDRNQIGIYMLDVCGHGVSAALIAVAVNQFLANHRMHCEGESGAPVPPKEILKGLAEEFPFERFNSFFSILYVTIDDRTGMLTYCCAGHPPPVVIRKDGRLDILSSCSPVIGIDHSHAFEEKQEKLRHGDKLVLYTDGVLETSSSEGKFFGKQGLYETLLLHGKKPIHDLLEGVYKSVEEYAKGTPAEDDISILALEYVG